MYMLTTIVVLCFFPCFCSIVFAHNDGCFCLFEIVLLFFILIGYAVLTATLIVVIVEIIIVFIVFIIFEYAVLTATTTAVIVEFVIVFIVLKYAVLAATVRIEIAVAIAADFACLIRSYVIKN